jgi:hypothetical protein
MYRRCSITKLARNKLPSDIMGSGGLVVNSSSLDKVINESWFDEEFCIHGMPWPIFYTKKKTL